jgi:hypothetical protein
VVEELLRRRRRVIVAARPDAADAYGDRFEFLSDRMAALASEFTDDELELIGKYVHGAIEIIKEQTERLRGAGA